MIGENSDGQVAKVRRDTLEALFTCPLCKQLYNEALSINECMHTCMFKSFLYWLVVVYALRYSLFVLRDFDENI